MLCWNQNDGEGYIKLERTWVLKDSDLLREEIAAISCNRMVIGKFVYRREAELEE
jgi:hypothetical protein